MTYIEKLRKLLEATETATHAQLDQIHHEAGFLPHRGKRSKLKDRRAAYADRLAQKIARAERNEEENRKRDEFLRTFIGPLTPQQRNGHPF